MAEQALATLVRVSRHRNTKLRDIAERIGATGLLNQTISGEAQWKA